LLCSQHKEYVDRTIAGTGLGDLEEEAINDIRISLRCAVEHGVRTEDLTGIRYGISNQDALSLFLRNPRTTGGRFIEGTKRAYVLNHDEWIANPRLTGNAASLGTYLYDPAVILLHSNAGTFGTWCRNVLIHETLHSVSLYSRICNTFPDIIAKHRALIEGLNECLTGYVLCKQRPECYGVWKLDSQGNCRIAYRETTRLFCSLAQIIGINPIARFYFSTETSFNAPWNRFVESVRSIGSNQFSYALSESTAFREPLFRDECVKSIAGFRKIYDSQAKSLDFSRIP
jgi:hypothetical protein